MMTPLPARNGHGSSLLHQRGADAITICPRCDGSGHWWGGIACWLCAGKGRVEDARARTFNRWGIREDRNA